MFDAFRFGCSDEMTDVLGFPLKLAPQCDAYDDHEPDDDSAQ
eukprot:IDg5557t1